MVRLPAHTGDGSLIIFPTSIPPTTSLQTLRIDSPHNGRLGKRRLRPCVGKIYIMATQPWDKCKPQNLSDRFEESRRWQRRWYCLEFQTYWGILANACTVALDDIEKGEELFALQLADVLSVETSRLSKLLPQELENLDEWLSLVLYCPDI